MSRFFQFFAVLLLLVFLGFPEASWAQVELREQRLQTIAEEAASQWKQEKAEAEAFAREKGLLIRKEFEDGRVIELMRLEDGRPVYNVTHNREGAETSSVDEVWPSGNLGLSLTGASEVPGLWEGGAVRTSHQEFGGRVTQLDETGISGHATHVAGTMVAAGVDADARGMAFEAGLDAYDWDNDRSEMASAAAEGLRVSNHSYGQITGWHWDSDEGMWKWYGAPSISETEDMQFGFYGDLAQGWDEVVYNAPRYVVVKSAGNDRNEAPSSQPVEHLVWDPESNDWVTSETVRDPDGGTDGYHSLGRRATAKNIITVGAVEGIPGGYSSPSDVTMPTFSGWGPTDDGRIKPDVVAKGVSVFSSLSESDSEHGSKGGTSMSSPMVSGSVALLQEHYGDLYGGDYPLASTVKGLLIHTADEAGNEGPDYRHGWGLMNVARAAELMSTDAEEGGHLREPVLSDGDAFEYQVSSDGTEPLAATLAWTDPEGTPPDRELNPNDQMLVNDLDVRIEGPNGIVHQPYVLDPSVPGNPAQTGDNSRDNVEQVLITAPTQGGYTIRVSHKGSLIDGPQTFSLITSGGSSSTNNSPPTARDDNDQTTEGESVTTDVLANDSDSDGSLDESTVTVQSSPANGSTSVDASTGKVTYTPNGGFTGTDSYTYTVEDNDGAESNEATVTIEGRTSPTVSFELGETSVAPGGTAAIDLSVNGFENVTTAQFTVKWDPTVASFSAVENFNLKGLSGSNFGTPDAQNISDGTLTVSWEDPDAQGVTVSDGTVIFGLKLEAAGAAGEQTALSFADDPTAREVTVDFSVVTFAGTGGSVTIEGDNSPPTASDDSDQTTKGEPVTIEVLDNDSDSDGSLDESTVTVQIGPSNGSTSVDASTGEITYTPDDGFTGTDSYTYTVADNDGARSNEATVTIDVNAASNLPPIAPVANSPQQPGSEFWVDVRIGSESNNVQNLNQIGFDLDFEPQHLSHVDDEAGSFLGENAQYSSNVDSDNGIVALGVTRTDDEGKSGSGVVARVRLAVGEEVAGGTELTFSVQNVQAEDPNNNSIDLNPQDLDVTVQSGITVWPGDMDNDGEVDQFDIFPLGDHWGATGPSRAEGDQGCEWRATTAQPWTPEAATHADANGDGEVNQFDIFCLGDNWGKTSNDGAAATASAAGKGAPSHSRTGRLVLNATEAKEKAVWVTVQAREVKNLLGFGMELSYPAEDWTVQQVEPAAWLGEDVLAQTQVEPEAGRVGIGISRKGTGRSGSGRLVRLKLRPSMSAKGTAKAALLDNVKLVESAGRTAGGDPIDFRTEKSASLEPPEQLALSGGQPNPVRSSATIEYTLPDDQQVRLTVFDMLGRRVATLVDRRQAAGRKTAALNVSAEGMSSGTYLLRLTVGGQTKTSRITVVR